MKYPLKYVKTSSPARLADLEAAFHRVRMIAVLGAGYNVVREASGGGEDEERRCPDCGAKLRLENRWWPIPILRLKGFVDLKEARCAVAQRKREWAAAAPSRGSPNVGRS